MILLQIFIYILIITNLFYRKNNDTIREIYKNAELAKTPFLLAFSPFVWVENIFIKFKSWWKGKSSETEVYFKHVMNKTICLNNLLEKKNEELLNYDIKANKLKRKNEILKEDKQILIEKHDELLNENKLLQEKYETVVSDLNENLKIVSKNLKVTQNAFSDLVIHYQKTLELDSATLLKSAYLNIRDNTKNKKEWIERYELCKTGVKIYWPEDEPHKDIDILCNMIDKIL